MLANKSGRSLSKVDCYYLDSFFKQQTAQTRALNLTRVHGLLTAVISSPTLVKPSEWTSIIFAGEPEFANLIQANKVMDLMLELYRQITYQLKGIEPYQLLLWNGPPSSELNSMQIMQDWCLGYLEGVTLDPLWGSDAKAMELLAPLEALAKNHYFDNELLHHALLLNRIEDIYAYWLVEREEAIRQISDASLSKTKERLCPCGSLLIFDECACHETQKAH